MKFFYARIIFSLLLVGCSASADFIDLKSCLIKVPDGFEVGGSKNTYYQKMDLGAGVIRRKEISRDKAFDKYSDAAFDLVGESKSGSLSIKRYTFTFGDQVSSIVVLASGLARLEFTNVDEIVIRSVLAECG